MSAHSCLTADAAKDGVVWLAINSGAAGQQGNGVEATDVANAARLSSMSLSSQPHRQRLDFPAPNSVASVPESMLPAPAPAPLAAALTATPRYHSLDALRAVMMLLGLALHAACSYTTFPLAQVWVFKDQRTSHFADLIVLTIHTFRMPVFMVLAGFFAALLAKRRGMRAFLAHRARRVLVPFVVSFLLIIPLTKWAAYFAQCRGEGSAAPALAGLHRALNDPFFGTLGHLWFLYDLLLFYGALVFLRPLLPPRFTRAVSQQFAQAMRRNSGLVVLPFFAITTALCCFQRDGSLGTSMGLVPKLPILGVYFSFFGFGWLLYAERDHLHSLKAHLFAKGLLFSALIAAQIVILAHSKQLFSGAGVSAWVGVSAATGMGAAWVGFYFWAGLFLRYFDQPSAPLRYLTDASYAVYLVHLPLVYLVAGSLAPWQVSTAIKIGVVLVAVTALSLLFYATCVQRTFIGQALIGRRTT